MEDWQKRLMDYSSNKDAGLTEYQRALNVYRGKTAAGDTEGAQRAKTWSDQVNTAIGGIGNTRSAQATNALDKVGASVNSQPFQFKQTVAAYNPNNIQSDPAYQAALRQAQAGAQTATNNAMVGLGSRGIGNSSVAVDRANQIQQKAIGNVNDTILPQLMQQAYSRYQDEVNNDYRNQLANYQAQQDNISNLSKYAGTLSDLDQRDIDNRRRDKMDNQSVAQWYTQTFGVPFEQKDDWGQLAEKAKELTPLATQEFNQSKAVQDAGLTGMYNGSPTMDRENMLFNQNAENRRIGLSASSQGNSASNTRINQLMDVWQATGQAPSGLESLGVKPGMRLNDKNAQKAAEESAKKLDDEKRGLISAVTDPQNPMQYSEARKQIQDDLRVGFYTQAEADELLATLDQWANSAYATRNK